MGSFCKCDCHIEGKNVDHRYPCCRLVNSKYIDKDGEINLHKLVLEVRKQFKLNKK